MSIWDRGRDRADDSRDGQSCLVGDSPPMRELRRMIAWVAQNRVPVIIYGETGTGKELVAAELHARSGRRGAFVPVNVCAVGDTLFEDALFGHVRGAYTGAQMDSPGFLREAHEGTLFLDEIGGLATSLQAKLLRAIETGVFRPLGARSDVRSEFRVIAATNEHPMELVRDGRFRADLLHRLAGAMITVPTLAQRREDIPLLVEHFLHALPGGSGRRATDAALARLWAEDWSGNVRELRQVVETAAAFGGAELDEAAVGLALAYRPGLVHETWPDDSVVADRARLASLVEEHEGHRGRIAQALGVHRTTVYRRMRRCGLLKQSDAREHLPPRSARLVHNPTADRPAAFRMVGE
jgi:DNA-binding NtrC family response regulator